MLLESVLCPQYSRKGDGQPELEGIQYGKLIRALNAEIKHLETQVGGVHLAASVDTHG